MTTDKKTWLALQALIGDRITEITPDSKSDEGLIIKTDKGNCLIIGYSSMYGSATLNNEGLDLWIDDYIKQ